MKVWAQVVEPGTIERKLVQKRTMVGKRLRSTDLIKLTVLNPNIKSVCH